MFVTGFLQTWLIFAFIPPPQWWTQSQRVKLRRGCRTNPSWKNTARTFGALWRPCLFRMGLSWWSGSLWWPTTKSSTRCWFSLQSRTSWLSYWTCTGCWLYARTSDPPVAGLVTTVAFYESEGSDEVKKSYQGGKHRCCNTGLGKRKCFYSHVIPTIFSVSNN